MNSEASSADIDKNCLNRYKFVQISAHGHRVWPHSVGKIATWEETENSLSNLYLKKLIGWKTCV